MLLPTLGMTICLTWLTIKCQSLRYSHRHTQKQYLASNTETSQHSQADTWN